MAKTKHARHQHPVVNALTLKAGWILSFIADALLLVAPSRLLE